MGVYNKKLVAHYKKLVKCGSSKVGEMVKVTYVESFLTFYRDKVKFKDGIKMIKNSNQW